MLEMSLEDIEAMFQKSESEMIKSVGGQRKWDMLSDTDKSEKRAIMLEKTIAELGQEAFEKLSDEEKHHLHLFIWAGCSCHKDLNTICGGYMAMANWWKENELEGPVLLANCDNDPVIQERRNNTQAFMAAKFTEPADYQFLHQLPRDASGDERQRRKEIVEFHDKQQKEKTARKEKHAQKSKETAAQIAETGLILDKEKALSLKGQALKDQLKVFKNAGAPNLVTGKLPTLVAEI